jgi:hypothetical protein
VSQIGQPNYIAPTAITGQRYGLFSTALFSEDPTRWSMGVEFEPLEGRAALLRASECVDDYTPTLDPEPPPEAQQALPFVVVGGYNCKASSRDPEEAELRARLALAGGEERAVEKALMSGVGSQPAQFSVATTIGPVAGTGLVEAFRLLEAALGEFHHSRGTIHLPRSLAVEGKREPLFMREGQHLETCLGTYVACGSGYETPNRAPDGTPAAPGELFIYATGRPTIRRGEVFVQPDADHYLNKGNNDFVILAQRDYLVSFDGPVFAVLVDRSEEE